MSHPATSTETDTIALRIPLCATLKTVVKRYCGEVSPKKQKGLVQHVVATGHSAEYINTIYANQLMKLDVPKQCCAAPKGFQNHLGALEDWSITLNNHWASASPTEHEVT